jgi:hypothetical protein
MNSVAEKNNRDALNCMKKKQQRCFKQKGHYRIVSHIYHYRKQRISHSAKAGLLSAKGLPRATLGKANSSLPRAGPWGSRQTFAISAKNSSRQSKDGSSK